jgi:CheY-like chemotaxis protein
MNAVELVNLLLVEDCATDALFVRESLAGVDFPIDLHVVENAHAALGFLRREPPYAEAPRPGVILLDLNMPARNGHELLGDIKNDATLREIPVVIFTTSEAERDIAAAYRGGANCYVTKPRDFHAFARAVCSIAAFWLGVGKCT